MKQKTKYLSKATMSIVLALVLVVSTLAVGIVATNAAYLNGKPNAEANAADVAGDKTADVEDAAVGAKAPEAVGAKAGESVGTAYNAGGSSNYHLYLKDGTEYYNAYNVDITIDVTSGRLAGNNLTFTLKDENDHWYGNNEHCSINGNTNLVYDNSNGGYLENAKNYSSVTINIHYVDGNCKIFWKSGVSTTYTIAKDSMTNGDVTVASSASSGSTVTITGNPNEGYQLDTVTVCKTSTPATTVTVSGSGNTRTFKMPSYNVTVKATFTLASYTVSAATTNCTVTGLLESYHMGDTVNFSLTYTDDMALQSMTVKHGTANVEITPTGAKSYRFTMPAGNVNITAVCATTAGTVTVYFKSATAWVYQPFISVNGGSEVKMTLEATPRYLNYTPNGWNPKSKTGSLRYAWYKAELTGVDTSREVNLLVRGQDTYMEAAGTFNLVSGQTYWMACDNLMEGNELVDISSLTTPARDFYDTPLNMIDNGE